MLSEPGGVREPPGTSHQRHNQGKTVAKIDPSVITAYGPLSFEAMADLLMDGDFLAWMTVGALRECPVKRYVHFWRCDECRLIRGGKDRPGCALGCESVAVDKFRSSA